MKALESLARLYRLELDEKRKRLVELELGRAGIEAEQADLARELRREKVVAKASLDASRTFTAYLGNHEARKDRLAERLDEINLLIEAAADDVATAYQELKKYETALANRKARAVKERERQDRIEQDEIAINIFRRSTKSA